MAEVPEKGQTQSESSAGSGSLSEKVCQAAKRADLGILIKTLEQHRSNRRPAQALNISDRSLTNKICARRANAPPESR